MKTAPTTEASGQFLAVLQADNVLAAIADCDGEVALRQPHGTPGVAQRLAECGEGF
jgi:hypothetical protein